METSMIMEFLELVKEQSYIAAADKLFISQPTLSRHIKKLEEDVGYVLVDRNARKFQITPEGEVFLPYAKRIVELEDESIKAIAAQEHADIPVLRIGTIPSMVPYGITDFLADFHIRFPNIDLVVSEMGYAQMLEAVREDSCEFAIVREVSDPQDEYSRIAIGKDRMVAVLLKDHPLACEKQLQLSDLKEEKLLLPAKDSSLYQFCVNACRTAGFEPKVSFASRGVSTALGMVSKKMGVALLMRRPAEETLKDGQLILVDVQPPLYTTISVLYKSQILKNPFARKFLSAAAAFAKGRAEGS